MQPPPRVMPVAGVVLLVIVEVVPVPLVATGMMMRVAHALESASKTGLQHLANNHHSAVAVIS
jgi:hypothetical protein